MPAISSTETLPTRLLQRVIVPIEKLTRKDCRTASELSSSCPGHHSEAESPVNRFSEEQFSPRNAAPVEAGPQLIRQLLKWGLHISKRLPTYRKYVADGDAISGFADSWCRAVFSPPTRKAERRRDRRISLDRRMPHEP